MNNLAIQPEIDFKYWYEYSKGINQEKNKNDEPKIKRHYDVINMVYEKYNNGIKTAYFTQYNNDYDVINEVKRLKQLSYFELENEIISLINEASSFDFYIDNDSEVELILKIFDLIQIWGGIPGGGGPYQTRKNVTWRSNPDSKWIKQYKIASKLAYNGKVESYDEFRKLKHLGGLAFASKHVYFYSKHLNESSLIIIDVKIAHCFLIQSANDIKSDRILKILDFISKVAKYNNLSPWEIEKSLFAFHLLNFKGRRRILNDNIIDVTIINKIDEWYNLSNNNNKPKDKLNSTSQQKIFILTNGDYRINTNGTIFISKNYISKNKNIGKLINKNSSIKINGIEYFEYIGDKERLEIN
jgi:hypothetical protein